MLELELCSSHLSLGGRAFWEAGRALCHSPLHGSLSQWLPLHGNIRPHPVAR